MRSWIRRTWIGVGFLLALLGAGTARALVIVQAVGPSSPIAVGASFQIDLVADLGDPILGWGLDLVFDPAVIAPSGAPTIGPGWAAAFAPDGDGLAGLAFPNGITGSGILLASQTFTAIAPGTSAVDLAVTPGDLTEGFALDPTGFAAPSFLGASVDVPEPGGALLLALAAAAAGLARRSRLHVRP
jgi:hypothetical protein